MALTLKTAITAGQTTFDVLGADDLQPGDFKTIDSETVVIRTVRSKTLDYGEAVQSRVSVYRGSGGTRAAAHAAAAELATYSAGGGGSGIDVTGSGGGSVTGATALSTPGTVSEFSPGVASLGGTVVVSPDDPGAIGAGNLWLQSNPGGVTGDDYYQLNVRNDDDDGWFGGGPIVNTDRETYVTIASPDDSVELMLQNDGEGPSSISADLRASSFIVGPSGPSIIAGTDAPTFGGGVAAEIGSVYLKKDDGTLWTKTGAGDTAWTEVFGPDSLVSYTPPSVHITTDGEISLFAATLGVLMPGLPTADPVNENQLWNDAGTLKVSAG